MKPDFGCLYTGVLTNYFNPLHITIAFSSSRRLRLYCLILQPATYVPLLLSQNNGGFIEPFKQTDASSNVAWYDAGWGLLVRFSMSVFFGVRL